MVKTLIIFVLIPILVTVVGNLLSDLLIRLMWDERGNQK